MQPSAERHGSGLKYALIAAAIAAATLVIATSHQSQAPTTEPARTTVVPPAVNLRADTIRATKLDLTKLSMSDIGTAIAAFRVENPTGQAFKDLQLVCSALGASGTAIMSFKKTIYERFPARSKRTISGFDLGWMPTQTKAINCRIDGLTIE